VLPDSIGRIAMSGGAQAAYGYRYQYLVTLDVFLRYLRDHLDHLASAVLHVEPTELAVRGIAGDEDIVDFAIEVNENVVLTAQVKSSIEPASTKFFPARRTRYLTGYDQRVRPRRCSSRIAHRRRVSPLRVCRCSPITPAPNGLTVRAHR
jgi:hypothetical protein